MDSRGHILLVDDDAMVAKPVARRLRREGYSVAVASTAAEALATTDQFDAGIFDIDLPDACGIDIAERMIASGQVRRVIFFSGTAASLQARAERVAIFVPKGDGIDPLLRAIVSVGTGAGRVAKAVGDPDASPPARFPSEAPSGVRRRR